MRALSAEQIDPVVALVARATQGDREAETALCRRFTAVVRAFSRRRLRASERREAFVEAVFVTFVDALRRGAIEQPDKVGAFLLGVCRTVTLDSRPVPLHVRWAQY